MLTPTNLLTPTKARERKVALPADKAVRVLLLIAAGVLLYVGRAAFIPVALAALIALVLSGPVECLRGFGVPRAFSALLLLLAIGAVVAGLVTLLAEPAKHWFADAPHTLRVVARKVRPVQLVVVRIEELRLAATRMGSPLPAAPAGAAMSTTAAKPTAAAVPAMPVKDTPAPAASTPTPVLIFDATAQIALDLFTVLVLTLFLLTAGPPMLARMTAALVSDLNASHVLCLIEKVRHEVGRFYVTTALINVGLALATGVAMWLCGMPNPFLWGTVVGLLNFIPYAGPTASFIVLTAIALVSFDDLTRVATVAGCFLGLTAFESHCVQPLLVGRRLELAPLLVFLMLWFSGFFWGLAGVILATPALVVLKVIAENSARGAPLLSFLSPDRRPRPSAGPRELGRPSAEPRERGAAPAPGRALA